MHALRGYGILSTEEAPDNFKPVECAYCHETNPSDSKYCHYCGVPLGEEGAKFLEEREKKTSELEELLKRIVAVEEKLGGEG